MKKTFALILAILVVVSAISLFLYMHNLVSKHGENQEKNAFSQTDKKSKQIVHNAKKRRYEQKKQRSRYKRYRRKSKKYKNRKKRSKRRLTKNKKPNRSKHLKITSAKTHYDKKRVKNNIDPEEVLLRNHKKAIHYCYKRALRSFPGLKGKVAVSFNITRQGRAKNMKITRDTIGSSSVNRCIKRVLKRSKFPKQKKTVEVSKSYVFSGR